MLKLASGLIGQPVVSLRTGQPVAVVTAALINPDNLKIEGFFCQDNIDRSELILLYQDIRDLLAQGFVINDHDVLAHSQDLVRLSELIDRRFNLLGKPIVSVNGNRYGKLVDYMVEVETMFIHKIYAKKGFIKGFTESNLGIDRNQIHDVTDAKIVILDPLESGIVHAGAAA